MTNVFQTPAPTAPRSTAVAVPGISALTSLLAGSGGGNYRRISIRGGVFREIDSGQEVYVHETRAINVVIINASPVSRTYYANTYVEGEVVAPTCWSPDGKTPDASAAHRQSDSCASCPQNIKGSGQGESRACRFQQRLAVMFADDNAIMDREVYQLQVPATSLFGDTVDGKMSLQAYARFLQSHKTDISTIVTEVRLDPSSSTPKLVFKAIRPLTEDEIRTVQEMATHDDSIKAITMTVAAIDTAAQPVTVQAAPAPRVAAPAPAPAPAPAQPASIFGGAPAPAPAPQPAPAPAPQPAPTGTRRGRRPKTATETVSAAPAVMEPTKVQRGPATVAETAPRDLSSIVSAWDDE